MRTANVNRYAVYSDYTFAALNKPVEIEAMAVILDGGTPINGIANHLVFVTNSPFGTNTIVYPGDSLTSAPDPVLGGTDNRWLFSWETAQPNPVEGPLQIFRGAPPFEVSGSQHAWLYPQRANMIANPTFSSGTVGMGYWSGNGALTRVSGGAPGAGAYSGQCAGVGGFAIMESNMFPTRLGEIDSEQWTIQLMAKGDGILKAGLVYWDADYRMTQANWGEPDEEWPLSTTSWMHVAVHRHAPQAHIAMVRLELQGTTLTIDRVLAERGYLKDWLYFDGDERYGGETDFSWYGNRAGRSYSMWYNHRRDVLGRLFASQVDPSDPGTIITDEEVDAQEQGLVYRWVPAGITVHQHPDVFYPFDLRNEVPTKASGVLPYFSSDDEPDGVINPWTL